MALLALLAPALCVALVRYTGPKPAAAAPAIATFDSTPPPEIQVSHAPDLTPDQRAAARRFDQLTRMGPSRSPFPIGPTLGDPELDAIDGWPEPADRDPTPQTPQVEPPSVRFTSIMSQPNLMLAVVDGRLCGIGSLITPEWRLVHIDPAGRVVILRHRTGSEAELFLPTP